MKIVEAIEQELKKALAPEDYQYTIGYGRDLEAFVQNKPARPRSVFISYDGFRGLEYSESAVMMGYQRDVIVYVRTNTDIELLSERLIHHFYGGGDGVKYFDDEQNEHHIYITLGAFSEDFGRAIFEINFAVV